MYMDMYLMPLCVRVDFNHRTIKKHVHTPYPWYHKSRQDGTALQHCLLLSVHTPAPLEPSASAFPCTFDVAHAQRTDAQARCRSYYMQRASQSGLSLVPQISSLPFSRASLWISMNWRVVLSRRTIRAGCVGVVGVGVTSPSAVEA